MASLSKQEQNKQLVSQFFETLDRQDTEMMDQLVSSTNYSLHFSGMPPMDWNENKKEFLAPFTKAFPDLRRNIVDMVAEGDKVAVSRHLQRRVPGYTADWQAGIFHCNGHPNYH
jgi:predicted SnoaL-like aldol condensation-catalyzing enzyme